MQLPDGTYDAFVVEVEEIEGAQSTIVRLELVITSGEHKNEVVAVLAGNLHAGAVELIGMPATLVVHDGEPSVAVER